MNKAIYGGRRRVGIGLCAAALATGAAACNRSSSAVAPAAATDASTTPSDEAISSAVRRIFSEDPMLAAQGLDVKTKAGVVIVSGTASTLLVKRRALDVPRTLRGVRAVDDEAHVAPQARPDAEIRGDIERTITDDPTTHALALNVDVKGGVVTLGGVAGSWAEKRLAGADAASVVSVVQVENRIDVPFATSRSDAAITTDVRARLASDVWLEGAALEAVTSNGIVTLTGTVETVAQRERAYDDAWVLGVRGITNSGVAVDQNATVALRLRAILPSAPLSDAQIVSAVKAALENDPRVKSAGINVSAKDGGVALSGLVEGARARASAVEDARDTVGVAGVQDDLDVKASVKPDDARMASAAKAKLASDGSVPDGKSLDVKSVDGSLRVSGELDSAIERERVLSDLAAVTGARRVVDETRMGVSPPVSRARIEDLFAWDPLVRGQDVHVSVDEQGVATLTGAATWGGARAAMEDARRIGSPGVENRLKIVARAAPR